MEVSGYLGKRAPKAGERGTLSLSAAVLAATGFGLGELPGAPGTWASGVVTLIWYGVFALWPDAAVAVLAVSLVLLLPLAWIASGLTARAWGSEDPSKVVIDEVVGQSIPFLFVPAGWAWFLAGFALFRLFDILKPPPVRQCERLPGGLGILMDDVAAGLYAGLVLWLVHAS